MKQPDPECGARTPRQDSLTAALFAIATVLMLQSTRAFVSYLVFVVDQSQRMMIATIALAVFAFPLAGWLLNRLLGVQQVFAGAVLILAVSRLGLQIIEQPVFRLASGGIAVAAWGVLAVLLIASGRRPIAAGLVLGFAGDLALRNINGPLDLVWMPGLLQTVQVIAAIGLLLVLWWALRDSVRINGASWRSAIALVSIGPAIALYHTVTGNPAFATTHTGFGASGAAALMAGGIALGCIIAVLRLMAISLGAGSGPLVSRFVLFDAIIGAIALGLAWEGDGLGWVGLFFGTVAATELVIFALAVDVPAPVPVIGSVALMTTLGLLAQFIILFIYYTETGSGWMVGAAWLVLVAGALVSVFTLSGSLQRQPLGLRTYALPAGIAVVILAASIAVPGFARESPEPDNEPASALTVMSYNIQSGFARDNYWDIEETARVIEASQADVVILQEVSRGWLVTTGNDQLTWLSERLDMPYAWGPASTDDLWGNAVLSRFPIESTLLTRYTSTVNLKRSALTVDLLIDGSYTVTVVATHLDNPDDASDARSEQIDQLAALLPLDRPTIVAGDFNMTPDDTLIRELIGLGLVDTGEEGGAEAGTSEDGRRIDYIFVTPDFEIIQAEVIESDASDHRPVTATLGLP